MDEEPDEEEENVLALSFLDVLSCSLIGGIFMYLIMAALPHAGIVFGLASEAGGTPANGASGAHLAASSDKDAPSACAPIWVRASLDAGAELADALAWRPDASLHRPPVEVGPDGAQWDAIYVPSACRDRPPRSFSLEPVTAGQGTLAVAGRVDAWVGGTQYTAEIDCGGPAAAPEGLPIVEFSPATARFSGRCVVVKDEE